MRVNSIKEIRRRLESGVDPQKCIVARVSPLRWAASRNRITTVRILLEFGHPVAGVLGHACRGGSPVVLQALIDAGADVNETGFYVIEHWLCTSLMVAVNRNDPSLVKFLLDAGAKTEVVSPYGICSPLLQHLGPEVAKLLLDAGADVHVRLSGIEGALTPLHYTTDPSIAKLLIEYGADLEADSQGGTPLRNVVISPPGRYPPGAAEALIKLFVEYGADRRPGVEALEYAEDPNIVEMLTPRPKKAT